MDAFVRFAAVVNRLIDDAAAACDLTAAQARLLMVLEGSRPRMGELAELMYAAKPGVSGLIDRAVARGLVCRDTGQDDRRRRLVQLTPEGRRQAVALRRMIEHRIGVLVGGLSECEQAGFADVLEKLLAPDPASARTRVSP